MNLRVRNDSLFNVWASFTDVAISMLLIFVFFILLQFISNSKAWLRMRIEERQGMIQTAFEKAFADEIQNGELRIDVDGNLQRFTFSDHILFDTAQAELKPQGRTILRRVGRLFRQYQFLDEDGTQKEVYKQIHIEGHTDDVPISNPQFPSNWHLSSARSIAVVRLFQAYPIRLPSGLLSATGYGEYQPVAPNTTETSRAINRRIEIVLVYTEKE
jgi:chemotaxis protein MotB